MERIHEIQLCNILFARRKMLCGDPLSFRILAPWRIENDEDDIQDWLCLKGKELSDLMQPQRLLDIMQTFLLFTTNKKKQERQKLLLCVSNNMKDKQNCGKGY
jgi:type I site-specific restriction-modification system R (restriction) subunit